MNNADDATALQTQLALMEQLHEMLLYMVTHELRTPVMTIMGFADILRSDWQGGVDVTQSQPHLERIRSAAQRQSAIIQGLQQIAYLQRQPLELESVDLSELIRTHLGNTLPANHNFHVDIANTDIVQADASMISTVVHALLTIVIMISQSSSEPTLRFGLAGNGYFLSGRGEGFGLGPKPTLSMLLRRLQSGTDYPGAGMYLLTAATIIHRHGGELRFSEASNAEITFQLTLMP